MKYGQLLLTLLLAAGVAYGVAHYAGPQSGSAPAPKETAFERVMRTNTLRCGYYIYAPLVMRDPNTGRLSGATIDMMNYLAEKTGLKIEWTEEITFGNWVPALQANRFDAVCAPMWPDAGQSRAVLFTRSLMYSAIYPFVRVGETRFGADWRDLNKPEVRLVVQEGNVTAGLAREWFPKATIKEQPASVDYGALIQDVIDGKADVVLWDINGFAQYEKNNPGKVKLLRLEKPLKIMPFELPVEQKEAALRDFLNGILDDVLNTGTMDRILDKWQDVPGAYFRVAEPYAPAR